MKTDNNDQHQGSVYETNRIKGLPLPGSPAYYILLGVVAVFILGPLGGISAAYMNFSIGFFVGGQVLAGILGSAVTFGYGAEGKHGANYMQTMAASVATMSGMCVIIQAMVWLGMPEPSMVSLITYLTSIGMFGVGVGMLYTPVLVDRMQLPFPSGLAVANILRALTDIRLLKKSIRQLGAGFGLGFITGFLSGRNIINISSSTFGAGMVVQARIAIPALVAGVIGYFSTPILRAHGWLGAADPFRKVLFISALGMILGAALVDIIIILVHAIKRLAGSSDSKPQEQEDWKRINQKRLIVWIIFWGMAIILTGHYLFNQPLGFQLLAIFLVIIFLLVNGISLGITDSNPISSAFVLTVFLMAIIGLKDPATGLMAASIVLVSCAVGGDMQQDRSTGWRLGTNRIIQFRFQVLGIFMGSVLSVVLAKLFMNAFPVLAVDTFTHPDTPGADQWQSAMTYKFIGALKSITNPQPYIMKFMIAGVFAGTVIEIIRKVIFKSQFYQKIIKSYTSGKALDFLLDSIFISSPYAFSFGWFVDLSTSLWFAAGGVAASLYETLKEVKRNSANNLNNNELPSDMNETSLIGGGLIGGDSLAALAIGVSGLISSLVKRLF